ncbi:hypothetical protein ACFWAT_16430 [Streptomyces syringium]|uniref:hypothetical protein n=1 Tax=Streptomyces syringium TaxID=76729 RepID=UPI00365738D8
MFEIRVICTEPDVLEITKALSAAFTTGTVRQQRTRDGQRMRLYITADHRPDTASWTTPNKAYADAPPVFEEMASVLTLAMSLHRPGGYTPAADREYRLRKAALLDRVALSDGGPWGPEVAADAEQTAVAAAVAFAQADSLGDHKPGPTGPNSQCWALTTHRGYVRQEYARWLADQ